MQRIELAQSIMKKFARETGLSLESNGTSQHPPRRYLWTDAFAVCNYLGLYQQSNRVIFLQHAACLVEQVHQILGMHREDSERQGWLSGFDDIQAQLHPTQGGLRIGKPLDERKINAIENQLLEWQQDGQIYNNSCKKESLLSMSVALLFP